MPKQLPSTPEARGRSGARVLLLGSAGGHNHGDNAVLEQNMRMVLARLPDAVFVVPSSRPRAARALFADLPVRVVGTGRSRFFSPAVISQGLQCDAAVTYAGIFFDYQLGNLAYSFIASLAPVLALCRLRGIPVVGFNVGIQRPTTSLGRRMMRICLSLHERLFLRDPGDAETVAELGVRTPACAAVDSAIVGRAASPNEATAALGSCGAEAAPMIGINLTHMLGGRLGIGRASMNQARLLAHFADALREVHHQTSTRLLLVATERHDRELLKQLKEKLVLGADCVLAPFLDYRTTRAAIGLCEFFVGSRLHSLIFACGMRVPFAGIPYQPKVPGFVRMVGLGDRFLLHDWWKSPDALSAGIVSAFRLRHKAVAPIQQFMQEALAKASLGADWLARRLAAGPGAVAGGDSSQGPLR